MLRKTSAAMVVAALAAYVQADLADPIKLTMAPQQPSVYELPKPPAENEGINMGAVNLDIKVSYFNDYVYRGLVRSAFINSLSDTHGGDNSNFQFDGRLEWNLGKLPHPFIGIFANVLGQDPVSNFQEVRPFFGAEWKIRPLVVAVGNTSYVFPDRSDIDTAEVFTKVTLDDSILWRSDEPILSPYIFAAYDYDLYDGWYLEAGVSHTFPIEGLNLSITTLANVACVINNGQFAGPSREDTGFQHWEVGLIAKYSLNNLLNIPQRYGQWSINGYIYYDDGIDADLRHDSKLWGGAGIEFAY